MKKLLTLFILLATVSVGLTQSYTNVPNSPPYSIKLGWDAPTNYIDNAGAMTGPITNLLYYNVFWGTKHRTNNVAGPSYNKIWTNYYSEYICAFTNHQAFVTNLSSSETNYYFSSTSFFVDTNFASSITYTTNNNIVYTNYCYITNESEFSIELVCRGLKYTPCAPKNVKTGIIDLR